MKKIEIVLWVCVIVVIEVVMYVALAGIVERTPYTEVCGSRAAGQLCDECCEDCLRMNATCLHFSSGGFSHSRCSCIVNGTVQNIW